MAQPNTSTPSPVGQSPHGSTVAYYRLRDDALVVRDVTTGKVRVVPGEKWLPDLRRFSLSPGGRFAAFPYGWNGAREPLSRVVDTVTGQVHTFPFTAMHILFSPDNRHVLVYPSSDFASRTRASVVVYSTETWTEVRRGTSPVSMPAALRMGGATLAWVDPSGGTPYIRLRDIATGAPAGTAMKMPAGERPIALTWDRADHLDLLTEVVHKTDKRFATYRIRRANGGMRVIDTYTHSKRTTF
ncbi:hypothetical protein GBF35_43900 [Nonomuraea phyllanthi]|uniref:hypothetical protein n=1 Tax=Nonomuraea phyllanthi TaxID=2219224 RepID=UPI0012932994|nr:hypothetical protein [Nonomuraea phyllanthi]QFY12607.1 hypothetical protein GBF35_43900 [Nonomuraea phyllanthi]